MNDFKIGDYVIADRGNPAFACDTFVIVGFGASVYGRPLVKVERINRPGGTMFFPSELSFEDGTRPGVQS